MFVNLLAAIESDINAIPKQLSASASDPIAQAQVIEKHQRLKELVTSYINLQNQYREISGIGSIY